MVWDLANQLKVKKKKQTWVDNDSKYNNQHMECSLSKNSSLSSNSSKFKKINFKIQRKKPFVGWFSAEFYDCDSVVRLLAQPLV